MVWDFCRAVDDAVDEAADAATAAAEVVKWRAEVGRLFGAEPPLTPQARTSSRIVSQFSLSRQPFDDLVDGVEMDLHDRATRPSTSWSATAGAWRRRSALICIEIFGCRDSRSRDYAFNLGLALQLTNIIRDVGVDLATGRVYLPQEDLAQFGVTEDDLRAGKVTEPVRRLLAHECQRARQFFTAAAQAMPPPRRAGWWPPRSWAASISRSSSASSSAATTCSPK